MSNDKAQNLNEKKEWLWHLSILDFDVCVCLEFLLCQRLLRLAKASLAKTEGRGLLRHLRLLAMTEGKRLLAMTERGERLATTREEAD